MADSVQAHGGAMMHSWARSRPRLRGCSAHSASSNVCTARHLMATWLPGYLATCAILPVSPCLLHPAPAAGRAHSRCRRRRLWPPPEPGEDVAARQGHHVSTCCGQWGLESRAFFSTTAGGTARGCVCSEAPRQAAGRATAYAPFPTTQLACLPLAGCREEVGRELEEVRELVRAAR